MALKLAQKGDAIFMNPAKTEIFLRHVAGKTSPNDFKFTRKGDKLGVVLETLKATFTTSTGPQVIYVYKFKRDFYDSPLFVIAGEAVHGADVQQKWLFDNIQRIELDTTNRLNDLGDIFSQAQAKGVAIPETYIQTAKQIAARMNARQEKLANAGYVNPNISGVGVGFLPALTLLPRLAPWAIKLWPWIVRGVTVLGAASMVAGAVSWAWNKWGTTYDEAALDRFRATQVVQQARASLTPAQQQAFDNATQDLAKDEYGKGQDSGSLTGGLGKGLGQVLGYGALALGAYFLFVKK